MLIRHCHKVTPDLELFLVMRDQYAEAGGRGRKECVFTCLKTLSMCWNSSFCLWVSRYTVSRSASKALPTASSWSWCRSGCISAIIAGDIECITGYQKKFIWDGSGLLRLSNFKSMRDGKKENRRIYSDWVDTGKTWSEVVCADHVRGLSRFRLGAEAEYTSMYQGGYKDLPFSLWIRYLYAGTCRYIEAETYQ